MSALVCADPSRLGVNPIYDARRTGDTLRLQRHWPSDELRTECLDAESILPATCEVRRRDMEDLVGGVKAPAAIGLEDLVRRFVFVPLAPRYRRPDPSQT
jgi:hypothetical protein